MVERETPLARCPDAACRRAGRCRREDPPASPCLKLHETAEAARMRLAARLLKRVKASPPLTFASEEEARLHLARLKRALEERERRGD